MPTIQGTFTVDLPAADLAGLPASIGLRQIIKTFTGPLSATSRGAMIAHQGEPQGNAGYVALERVEGSVDGQEGSFALMHFGQMRPELSSLVVEVVPGSGRGGLEGLTGTMAIELEGGEHHYTFNYER